MPTLTSMDIKSVFDKEFLEGVRDDIEYEFRMIIKTVGDQFSDTPRISTTSYEKSAILFTAKFYAEANVFGLTENDAIEVYNSGQEINEAVIIREYNRYEIGIEYTQEMRSGKPLITSVWKREF